MNTILSNTLSQIIQIKENKENNDFKPNRQFFKDVGIGQKRFWQLVRNEKNLTSIEIKRLAEYFGVHILELHDFTMKYMSEPTKLKRERDDLYKRLGLVKS
jgi:Mg2+ and Co2+ transporter CorA